LPSLKAIVETVDHGIGAMQKDNVANRAIRSGVEQLAQPPEKWLQGVILTSTVGLAVVGLARLTQVRQRREKAAQLAAAPGGLASGLTLFEERHQSMLQNHNVWEAARALARQAFESTPGPTPAVVPTFRLPVSRWRNWRLRRRINRLWQLAYGAQPVRLSARQLKRLGPEVDNMKALLPRLVPPTGPHP